jgi:hypothetical protein
MRSRIPAALVASVLAGVLYSASMMAEVAADPVTIGIVTPGGVIGQGIDIPVLLRSALADGLREAGAQVVLLGANDARQAMAEAAQKNCAFVLWTRASRGKPGGMSVGKKMSMIMPHKPKSLYQNLDLASWQPTPVTSSARAPSTSPASSGRRPCWPASRSDPL